MALNSKTNAAQINVDDVVFGSIKTLVGRQRVFVGTMTDLSSALTKILGRKRSEVLPGSPGALRVVVNRVVNRLRNRSISVKFTRTTDHSRTRLVRFAR